MHFPAGLGEQAIQDVLRDHPTIGTILARYDVGCVSCAVGICLLQDVVSIHALGSEAETAIEREINDYLGAASSDALANGRL